jgi:para-aminobenzoate synthetase
MTTANKATVSRRATEPRLLVREIDELPDAERAFVHLYGDSANAFWLDSSRPGERGRFSFMGDSGGPLAAVVTYDVEERRVRVRRRDRVEVRRESVFDFLDVELEGLRPLSGALPFGLDCGFVGYLGYELKADCGATAAHRAATPDAAFVFADRLIAFDHEERRTYLLALTAPPPELHQIPVLAGREFDAVRLAEEWIEETSRRLEALPPLPEPQPQGPVDLRLRRSSERYLDDIAACKRYLTAGHSYEICLTNRLGGSARLDSLALYRSLRRVNPAPFSAYLRFGGLAVLSSSPERFLAVDREGGVETRPIKGSSRRGADPVEDSRLARALQGDAKSRAENVTIVDLMRNDLGRVCEAGSVEVPELMRVESYETVHQLVSGVRGRLREDLSALDCARACFPPGSMTGAPKLRTMEILDELEGSPRGVYSGAIGYFGLSGACDLSVAIRTIVLDGESLGIGAGGAIVADSDPRAELEEMLLKARAPAAALGDGASISFARPEVPRSSRRRHPSPTPS